MSTAARGGHLPAIDAYLPDRPENIDEIRDRTAQTLRTAAIKAARNETHGYLEHCYADRDAGYPGRHGRMIDERERHIAKLEAILAGLDALEAQGDPEVEQ